VETQIRRIGLPWTMASGLPGTISGPVPPQAAGGGPVDNRQWGTL